MHQENNTQALITQMMKAHQLPAAFAQTVEHHYLPLCAQIAQLKNSKGSTFYLAINGSQGSGKSTMAAFITELLSHIWHFKVANLSIDDFYLTRKERKHLAENIHPLLMTRGVPGTHDVQLAIKTLKQLATSQKNIPLVRFNKAIDDRACEDKWEKIDGPVDVVILEGWCMGIEPQSEADLYDPLNKLESEEDSNAKWRQFVNQQLSDQYPVLFNYFDYLVMLQAPSFDCVYQWRKRQEDKLKSKALVQTYIMSDTELDRFIQHYQRLTEHALQTLPNKANLVFKLDETQQFISKRGLKSA